MKLTAMILTAALAAALVPWAAHAQPRSDLVKAELLADVDSVKPGQPFTLGVLLRIEKGWHVYWENPGDSGMATHVQITASDGWKVEPVQLPVPVKFEQPGKMVGYGYLDRVLLMTKVTPPATLDSADKSTLRAAVSWLCCEKVCTPGSAKLELSLPVGEARPAHRELFDEWRPRVPVDAAAANVKTNAIGSVDAGGALGSIILAVNWDEPVKDVQWFPGPSDTLNISDVSVTPAEDGKSARVTFKTRVLAGQKLDADSLPSVVAYTDQNGVRRGVKVDVPLKAKAVRFSP